MAGTRATQRDNIRDILTDLSPDFPGIGNDRLNRLIESQMQTMPGVQFGDAWVTGAVTLSPGVSDYTLSSLQMANVQLLRLTSQGWELKKRTAVEMEALRIGTTIPQGDPTDYHVWEDASQVLKIRLYQTPDKADTLDRFGQLVPAALTADSSAIPFPDPLLRALEKLVAATCVSVISEEQAAKLQIDKQGTVDSFRTEAREAIYWEKVRKARLDRSGYVAGWVY